MSVGNGEISVHWPESNTSADLIGPFSENPPATMTSPDDAVIPCENLGWIRERIAVHLPLEAIHRSACERGPALVRPPVTITSCWENATAAANALGCDIDGNDAHLRGNEITHVTYVLLVARI